MAIIISVSVALLLTVIVAVYYYFKNCFRYFERRNIPFLEPSFPLGNVNTSFFHKYGQELKKLYDEFKKQGAKYGGFYLLTKPVILPIEPEILKTILTKDFQYFNNRGVYVNEEKEFLTAHLFTLSGTKWKTLRAKLTPSFSSNKLKNMVGIMLEKSKLLEQKLQELSSTSTSFEAKDLSTRLTTDIFCSAGFGIECNSIVDPDAEFIKYGRMMVENNLFHTIKLIIAITLPQLFDKLNLNFVKSEIQEFFIKTISEVVEYREQHSIDRPDLMNLLIKLKNNISIEDNKLNEKSNTAITMKQLLAQCYLFFLAGFDTSATTINYCLFELTQNQEIQNKLRTEINFILKKHAGKVTYEVILDMQYLDKVIAETLRKYPPGVVLNRECMEDYTIPGTDSVIEKGTSVMVSLLGLHHDPEHYPDPARFDPERFSDEEKAKRHPYAYLPFGEGPMQCIGLRLGILQTKIGIISLLRNYKYALNSKTKLPLEFKTEAIVLATQGDIWINVTKM